MGFRLHLAVAKLIATERSGSRPGVRAKSSDIRQSTGSLFSAAHAREANRALQQLWVIFDRPGQSCLPVHVGFAPKADLRLGATGRTRAEVGRTLCERARRQDLEGDEFQAPEGEPAVIFEAAAAGEIQEAGLAAWFKRHTKKSRQ
jgi:hypothetical protein